MVVLARGGGPAVLSVNPKRVIELKRTPRNMQVRPDRRIIPTLKVIDDARICELRADAGHVSDRPLAQVRAIDAQAFQNRS